MDNAERPAAPTPAEPRRGGVPRAARAVAQRSPHEPVAPADVPHDRREAGARTAALQARIEALSRELARRDGALLALLHALRDPVMPLLGAARVLQRGVDAAERDALVQAVERHSHRLERLLDEAATAARRGARPAPCQVLLQEALRLALGGSRAAAARRHQSLELVMPARPVTVRAEPERLQQTLVSLISHALECTPPGGRTTVSAAVEGGMAVTRIDAEGIGIAPDRLAPIFGPFAREAEAAAPAADGRVVGSAAVRRRAAQHGRSMEAGSPGHGGGPFILRLPLDAGSFVPG